MTNRGNDGVVKVNAHTLNTWLDRTEDLVLLDRVH